MHETLNSEQIGVSIVIPTFNEAETLPLLLQEIRNKLEKMFQLEIIVVDDGSSDGTYLLAEELGVKVIRHEFNKGYGASLKSGLKATSFPYIIVLDASGRYDPNEAIVALKILKQNSSDLVVFYNENIGRLGSLLLTIAVFAGTGVFMRAPYSNFFCLRRDILYKVKITENGPAASLDLFIRTLKKGYRISEIPTPTRRRLYYPNIPIGIISQVLMAYRSTFKVLVGIT
jgi:glycosyltransferase involved in cell wall biosynthesis